MIGLFLGEGDVAQHVDREVRAWPTRPKPRVFISEPSVGLPWTQVATIKDLKEAIQNHKLSRISFVGRLSGWSFGPDVAEQLISSRGDRVSFGTDDILVEILKIAAEHGVSVVPIQELVASLQPPESNVLIHDTSLTRRVFDIGIDYLMESSSRWSTACLANERKGLLETARFKNCADLFDEFESSRVPSDLPVFLCRFSKFETKHVRVPALGIQTVKDCARVGVSGILCKRDNTIVFEREAVMDLAQRSQIHIEFF